MADPSPLSERELDIMQMVVTGASNREIAHALDISPNTVKVHLRNVFDKLGVASRTEATLVVLREGWINVEGVARVDENGAGVGEEPPILLATPKLPHAEPDVAPTSSDEWEPPAADENAASEPPALVPAVYTVQSEPSAGGRAVLMPEVLVPTTRPQPSRFPVWLTALLGSAVLLLLALLLIVLLRPNAAPLTTQPSTVEVVRWRQLARLPAPRSDASAVSFGGDLILLGGTGDDGVAGEVYSYEPALGRWESLGALPRPVTSAPAISYGGKLLVVGGLDADGQPVSAVQSYDPTTGDWTELSPLPQPLARSALATFEGDLFLFGGSDGTAAQGTIYRYLPDEETWEPFGTLPSPRADLAAATIQEGIVLAGGTDEAGEALSEVLHFDPRAADPLRAEAPLPAPQAAPRMVSLGNALYLVGADTLLERGPERQWQTIALSGATLPAGAALAASDPYVYVVGGAGEDGPSATVWQYQAIFHSFIPMVPNAGDQTQP
ncbi:MAG TPA: kelch repeat-containing protein [Ardenticatenaceae bacterium]|jgi:DNA-binding CsgD family transcriptional regulator